MTWLLHSRMLSWHAWRHAACGAQRAPKRTAASCGSACGVAERCSGARSDRVRAYQPRSGADTCSGCTSASDAPSERPHSMAPMTAIDQAHRCAQDVRPNRMPARLSAQFASIGAACWPQRLSGRTAAAPGQSPAAGTLLGVRRSTAQHSAAHLPVRQVPARAPALRARAGALGRAARGSEVANFLPHGCAPEAARRCMQVPPAWRQEVAHAAMPHEQRRAAQRRRGTGARKLGHAWCLQSAPPRRDATAPRRQGLPSGRARE
jgi:hypothetical protein